MTLAGPRAWTTQEVLLGDCCPSSGLVSAPCVSQHVVVFILTREFSIDVLINYTNPAESRFCKKSLPKFHTLHTHCLLYYCII